MVQPLQYRQDWGTARYGQAAGERDVTWLPTTNDAVLGTILLAHAGGGDAFTPFVTYQANVPQTLSLGPLLATHGFRVISIDGGDSTLAQGPNSGGNHYGNPSHTARLETIRTNLGLTKFTSIIGLSMGGCSALQYAAQYPNKTKSIVGMAPLCNIDLFVSQAHDTNNDAAAAWGTTAPFTHAKAPTADLINGANANNLVGLPSQLWYSTVDTLIDPTSVTAMATKIGQSCEAIPMSVVHALACEGVDFDRLLSFVKRWA